MDRSIQAGVSGFLLAVVINIFSPVFLDFIPSFVAAIFAVYIFRLGVLKEGLVAALMTYVFNEGLLGTILLVSLYTTNETYQLTPDIWIVFSPIVTSITAMLAGYIGVKLVQKTKPAQELPPSVPPLPPV